MNRSVVMWLAAMVATAASCRDVPQAPNPPIPEELPYSTLKVDRLLYGTDVTPGWGALTIMLAADQSTHIVSMDYDDGRLRYAGCARYCEEPQYWLTGTADSGEFFTSVGAVLGPDGIHVVYMRDGAVIRYAHCPGACYYRRNWVTSNLFSGSIGGNGPQAIPLAVDSSGRLHLGFITPAGLWYATCSSGCGTPGAWQTGLVDSLPTFTYAIAATPDGRVDLLYPRDGLRFASCAGGCTSAAAWQVALVDTALGTSSPALALGPGGVVHAVYALGGGNGIAPEIHYAVCAGGCTTPGAWQTAGLGTRSFYVSTAVDAATGRAFVATSSGTTEVASCAGNCLAPAAWERVRVDTASSYRYLSVAVDAAGRARVASSWYGVEYTQFKE